MVNCKRLLLWGLTIVATLLIISIMSATVLRRLRTCTVEDFAITSTTQDDNVCSMMILKWLDMDNWYPNSISYCSPNSKQLAGVIIQIIQRDNSIKLSQDQIQGILLVICHSAQDMPVGKPSHRTGNTGIESETVWKAEAKPVKTSEKYWKEYESVERLSSEKTLSISDLDISVIDDSLIQTGNVSRVVDPARTRQKTAGFIKSREGRPETSFPIDVISLTYSYNTWNMTLLQQLLSQRKRDLEYNINPTETISPLLSTYPNYFDQIKLKNATHSSFAIKKEMIYRLLKQDERMYQNEKKRQKQLRNKVPGTDICSMVIYIKDQLYPEHALTKKRRITPARRPKQKQKFNRQFYEQLLADIGKPSEELLREKTFKLFLDYERKYSKLRRNNEILSWNILICDVATMYAVAMLALTIMCFYFACSCFYVFKVYRLHRIWSDYESEDHISSDLDLDGKVGFTLPSPTTRPSCSVSSSLLASHSEDISSQGTVSTTGSSMLKSSTHSGFSRMEISNTNFTNVSPWIEDIAPLRSVSLHARIKSPPDESPQLNIRAIQSACN